MFRHALLISALATSAFAQGTEGPAATPAAAPTADSDSPEAKGAKELLTKYLTAVKAKKWADAKKLLHPKTMEAIAERKKRMGKEDHPMAPWYHEKTDYLMKEFKAEKIKNMLKKIKTIDLPRLKPIETDSVYLEVSLSF
jgi:phosphoketolase